MKIFISTFLLCLLAFTSHGQLMKDENAQAIVKEVLDKIYNDEKQAAATSIKKLREKYGKHPIYPILNSMLLLGNLTNEEKAQKYMALLDAAEALSEAMIEKNKDDVEGMFFALTSHSYKALFHSEQKNYLKAIAEAQRTYRFIKKAYELTEEFPDFLLSVGLYNYYREQYPETHPAVKPFMGVFKNGDKELGLKQLEKCVEITTFTRPEALYYLTHIYLKYELEYKKGLKYAQIAFEDFPRNIYYRSRYAEGLLRNKKYEKALNEIEHLIENKDTLYQIIGMTFKGYYYEFGKKDDELAAKCYATALKRYEKNPKIDQEYICWCQIGLARILDRKGDTEQAKKLCKSAMDGEYENIRNEAHEYLKSN